MCVDAQRAFTGTLTFPVVYANSILAAYVTFSLPRFRSLMAYVSLNSRRSIDDRFMNGFSSSSLGAHVNGAPSTHPQQDHVIELESMAYNVPEVCDLAARL